MASSTPSSPGGKSAGLRPPLPPQSSAAISGELQKKTTKKKKQTKKKRSAGSDHAPKCGLARAVFGRLHDGPLAKLMDGDGEAMYLNGKLRVGELVCGACAAAPPCSDAKGCSCVAGFRGASHCKMHKDGASGGGAAAAAAETVTFNASGGCSNCKTGKTISQSARREKKRKEANTTSAEESTQRQCLGLAKQAPAAASRKKLTPIVFADFSCRTWAEMWYYWCKWGGGVPKGHNKVKWSALFTKLARKMNLIAMPETRETSGELAWRMYNHITRHHDSLLPFKLRTKDWALKWWLICSADIDARTK